MATEINQVFVPLGGYLGIAAVVVFIGYLLRSRPPSTKRPRRRHAPPDRAGIAMLHMQSILEPSKKYVIDAKRTDKKVDEDCGGPDESDYFR